MAMASASLRAWSVCACLWPAATRAALTISSSASLALRFSLWRLAAALLSCLLRIRQQSTSEIPGHTALRGCGTQQTHFLASLSSGERWTLFGAMLSGSAGKWRANHKNPFQIKPDHSSVFSNSVTRGSAQILLIEAGEMCTRRPSRLVQRDRAVYAWPATKHSSK